MNVYTTSDAKKNILLSPDEQAVFNKDDKALFMSKIDASSQAAWTTARLVVVNERLFDILKSIDVYKRQEHILPLDKNKIKTIGVIGPNADSRRALVGNYEGTEMCIRDSLYII